MGTFTAPLARSILRPFKDSQMQRLSNHMKVLLLFSIFAAGFLLTGCDTKQHSSDANIVSTSEASRKGESLFHRAVKNNPNTAIDVWGSGFPDVKASLWIPEDQWYALSGDDQTALVEHLKSQIPYIRRNPDQFTKIPKSDPLYSKIRSNIANMKDNAFVVFTTILKDGQWVQSSTVAESE